ncbi:helix-turn-helix domain-containing protein [Massilia orientalis]|uniref:Helix-turn-helix domain-containing protein n=1 Tax=Massilia orientalis TaxID=3050128 RepID=A0ACC7MKW0_9BURK|nr:AraC family transcriptional regulator [Massilia sp. YIM B02787]
MQEIYKKALLALILLVAANALMVSFFTYQSYRSLSLLPWAGGGVRLKAAGWTDSGMGGTSIIRILDDQSDKLRFDMKLTKAVAFPSATADLVLTDMKGRQVLADWSKYTSITFLAKCTPSNSMVFSLTTFDEKISKKGDFQTYRVPATYFPCNKKGVPVSLDLTRLALPDWWLNKMKLDLSSQGYALDKVAKISFGANLNSPPDVDSQVEISELVLHGRDYRSFAWLAVALLASWAVFAVWFFRAHSRALVASVANSLRKDVPLAAYRQLTLEPYKDKEKAGLLKYIATNYTDAHLDLESVVTATGINRTKVNDLLKSELGMTFTGYLNKLRLTEAARLVSENSGAAISEIAYSVGYANVSYFNKLFKEEYGCTPKVFRSISAQQSAPVEDFPVKSGADSSP